MAIVERNRQAEFMDSVSSQTYIDLDFTPLQGSLLAFWFSSSATYSSVFDNSSGTPAYDIDALGEIFALNDNGFASRFVGASIPTRITVSWPGSVSAWMSVVELRGVSPTDRVADSDLTFPFSTEGFGQTHTLPWNAVNRGDYCHMMVSAGGGGGSVIVPGVNTNLWYDLDTPAFYEIHQGSSQIAAAAGAQAMNFTTPTVDCNVSRAWVAYKAADGRKYRQSPYYQSYNHF